MSGSTDVVKDFATPDRGLPSPSSDPVEEKKETSPKEEGAESTKGEPMQPKTVTPPESGSRDEIVKKESAAESPLQIGVSSQVHSPADQDKHVRFGGEHDIREPKSESPAESSSDSPASNKSQRGLVSRRGGRCTSPGRVGSRVSSPPKDSVLEFKTFRSPQRKRDENDTNTPSLCSTGSFLDAKETKEGDSANSAALDDAKVNTEGSESHASVKADGDGSKKPLSISCDASKVQTSPLHSHEADQDVKVKQESKTAGGREALQSRKSNVTFSPVPPAREDKVRYNRRCVVLVGLGPDFFLFSI